jgi:hypothetical protein
LVQRCDFQYVSAQNWRDHHLRDAHSSCDRHRFLPKIYQQDLDLPPVIGVDRAGRIEHGEPMARCEARTWPHLGFISAGKSDCDPGWNECAGARRDCDWRSRRDSSEQIEPGG